LAREQKQKEADVIIQESEYLADITRQLFAYAKGGKYLDQSLHINAQIIDCIESYFYG
jgi:hypothetical protein